MVRGPRKSIRLNGYDYSQVGAYFVTICTQIRAPLFWQRNSSVGQGLCLCLPSESACPPSFDPPGLSALGHIVQNELEALPERFPSVILDKYVVMPDHIHVILIFTRQGQSPCPTLGAVVEAFKSITTKQINRYWETPGQKIWPFRYHDHIIRNEADYRRIWQYIDTNPEKWKDDCYYAPI